MRVMVISYLEQYGYEIEQSCQQFLKQKGVTFQQYVNWWKSGMHCDELGLHVIA